MSFSPPRYVNVSASLCTFLRRKQVGPALFPANVYAFFFTAVRTYKIISSPHDLESAGGWGGVGSRLWLESETCESRRDDLEIGSVYAAMLMFVSALFRFSIEVD